MLRTRPALVLAPALLAAPAAAQFADAWASFTPAPELLSTVGPLSNATIETDIAAGDLSGDGLDEVVLARKQPILGPGGRTNVLLENQGGTLVDVTASKASTSDVPGDLGFSTATTDADVVLADVNGDGLLDVVTSTSITPNPGVAKHLSHPRVYVNVGAGGGGWSGIAHEDSRIPLLLHPNLGTGIAPRFNGVAAADLTNDGSVDLYFTDMDSINSFGTNEPANQDGNDRLLYNDGSGFFTDATVGAMLPAWLDSEFANSAALADVNGDGAVDALKQTSHVSPTAVSVIYNDPSNAGTFTSLQQAYTGSPYFMSTGDLNNDGRVDIVVTDNGADGVVYNLGNGGGGSVNWSPKQTYDFLSGGDDGFGSNILVADVDGDGWLETLHTDVDAEFAGCNRRLHVYHNRGGGPGPALLREERQSGSDTDWVGAQGLTVDDLKGTHDVAVLDVDGDGRNELLISRCDGTTLWRQLPTPTCQPNLGTGLDNGFVTLSVCGGDLTAGNDALLELQNGPPLSLAFLVAAASANPVFAPQYGVDFAAQPPLFILPLATDPNGEVLLPVPGGLGAFSLVIQFIVDNPVAANPDLVSNAVQIDFQP